MIQSNRLTIRKATFSDAQFIFKLLNQDSFKTNIADKEVYSLSKAEEYIEKAFLVPYASGGAAPYIVTLKSGEAIGVCGLYQRPAFNYPDLGYAFLDEYTGLGYAQEAAESIIHFAQKQGYKQLCAITCPKNAPSINLLNKCGFTYCSQVILDASQGASNLYCLSLIDIS